MRKYPQEAIDRAKNGALEWLKGNGEGHPRSVEQEDRRTLRRGYEMYDDLEAPPILGYEALEREGMVVREEIVIVPHSGEERVHFRLFTKPV